MTRAIDPRDAAASAVVDQRASSYKAAWRIRAILWLVALISGLAQAWANRFAVSEDGLAYADMGDMLWRGDFQGALNAVWSPGYPFLLGLASRALQPSSYFQSLVIQLVNVVIFVGSIAAFDYFLGQLHRFHQDRSPHADPGDSLTIPGWAFSLIGYLLFLWSAVGLINVSSTTPDMLVSVFVYLILGLLIHIRLGASDYATFAFLGAALGVGYLSKAPLFIINLVCAGSSIFLLGNLQKGLRRGLLALAIFALIAAPWIVGISVQAGSPTIGKSGAYLYAREVNDIAVPVHWQGWPPEAGTPEHPTRPIFQKPTIYEFGTPIVGSYPPWQDIYYWYTGINPHFEFAGQLRVLGKNVRSLLHIIVGTQSAGMLFGLCVLLAMSTGAASVVRRLAAEWFILVPALAALGMFCVVLVAERYVGPYLAVIGSGLLAAVRLPDSGLMRRLIQRVTILIFLFWSLDMSMTYLRYNAVLGAGASVSKAIRGVEPRETNPHYEVATTLRRSGLQEGDKVAYIGESYSFFWARLAKVQVNAELRQFQTEGPPTAYASDSALARLRGDAFRHVDFFWKSEPSAQEEVMSIFAKSGSRAVVTDAMPIGQDVSGWIHVKGTRYYVRPLSGP